MLSNPYPPLSPPMSSLPLRVQKLHPNARIPRRAHALDSGLDLFALEPGIMPPRTSLLVDTGIAIELAPGTEGQIRSRSGLAINHSVMVLNSPGTIDEGYRGPLKVILFNHGALIFAVSEGMRVAQLVIAPVLRPKIILVEHTGGSDRGSSGFGSTGL